MSRAQEIATALLSATEHSIVPLTAKQVSQGSKLFGAAILDKASLSTVLAETNNERESPLLHGEINCIQQFFKLPKEGRPETKDCIFFAVSAPRNDHRKWGLIADTLPSHCTLWFLRHADDVKRP
jgi:tRNA(Arg) A34 adenosine deaminase TadA